MTRRNSRYEPPEVAALLNPALIALLLRRAAAAYLHEVNEGLPYIYVPIITTISLYPAARDTLSMNIATPFATWIDRSAQIQVSLQDRIVSMVPIANEGVLFAITTRVLSVESGALMPGDRGPTNSVRGDTEDLVQAQRTAVYLGRWLVRAGDPATVCAMLGVAP